MKENKLENLQETNLPTQQPAETDAPAKTENTFWQEIKYSDHSGVSER